MTATTQIAWPVAATSSLSIEDYVTTWASNQDPSHVDGIDLDELISELVEHVNATTPDGVSVTAGGPIYVNGCSLATLAIIESVVDALEGIDVCDLL